jgi:hypothetical protein
VLSVFIELFKLIHSGFNQRLDVLEDRLAFLDAPDVALVLAVLEPLTTARLMLLLAARDPALEQQENLRV